MRRQKRGLGRRCADAEKIPLLGATGVLDISFIAPLPADSGSAQAKSRWEAGEPAPTSGSITEPGSIVYQSAPEVPPPSAIAPRLRLSLAERKRRHHGKRERTGRKCVINPGTSSGAVTSAMHLDRCGDMGIRAVRHDGHSIPEQAAYAFAPGAGVCAHTNGNGINIVHRHGPV